MKKIAKPVNTNLIGLDKLIQDAFGEKKQGLGLSNAEDIYSVLTNDELSRSYELVRLLTDSKKLNFIIKLSRLFGFSPNVQEKLLKRSNLANLYGGATLLKAQRKVDYLHELGIYSILQYHAKSLQSETDFNNSMNNTINAIAHAATQEKIPMVSVKISGLVRQGYLEFLQSGNGLNISNWREYRNLLKRLDSICYTAATKNIKVVFAAEESQQQGMVDHLVTLMMKRYNKQEVIVYQTIQFYRKDGLQFLMDAQEKAIRQHYKIGVQLVKGGYRTQEIEEAAKMGYSSPLLSSKAAVDDAFNMALKFCLENFDNIAIIHASHAISDIRIAVDEVMKRKIPIDHPHFLFSQMLGLGDAITYRLARLGFFVTKQIPYGDITASVTSALAKSDIGTDSSTREEHRVLSEEMVRRKLL